MFFFKTHINILTFLKYYLYNICFIYLADVLLSEEELPTQVGHLDAVHVRHHDASAASTQPHHCKRLVLKKERKRKRGKKREKKKKKKEKNRIKIFYKKKTNEKAQDIVNIHTQNTQTLRYSQPRAPQPTMNQRCLARMSWNAFPKMTIWWSYRVPNGADCSGTLKLCVKMLLLFSFF